ncbi:MAG: ferritin family protein [Desulfobacteraceae bacterium]|jgi:rubrerythrin
MDFNNLTEIIDFAIAKEVEAEEFYRSVASQEAFAGKQEMFLEYAAEEKKHQALLEELKAGKLGKQMENYEFKWITDIKRSNYVHDVEYKPGMAYQDILMLACKREEKALALYNELQVKAENDEAKKVFKILCQEEAKHKLALETMYDDFMAKMGD